MFLDDFSRDDRLQAIELRGRVPTDALAITIEVEMLATRPPL